MQSTIKNFNPAMAYRRFGKSEAMLSVITLGGMRYLHGWDDPRHEVPADTIQQARDSVQRAMACGINHIETAHGYGKSEHCYGIVLNDELKLPRSSYYLMTKGAPESAQEVRSHVQEQLKALKTDYLDFYGWHGINDRSRYEVACAPQGPVEALLRLKEEGIIRHVGFSTHGPLDVIMDSIKSGLFDFVNLHYYYFFQRNRPAIQEAAARDMGVFIISPNDKGGRLYEAPQTLRDLTAPQSPIQWNARFCLSTPQVHTLSFGMNKAEHFEQMATICQAGQSPWGEQEEQILGALDGRRRLDRYSSIDPYQLPDTGSPINVAEMLRFRTMWKCYDMETWCEYRYNMFQEKGHWFAGAFATEENLAAIDERLVPPGLPLKELLREFHQRFYKPKK
jgi:predicted aldo/keto reductase-like oxidoreductase